MWRWVGVATAAVVGAPALTGCTVPPGGVMGLTVDANGDLLAVVQMCEGQIDGATLYLPSDSEIVADEKTIGRWEVSPPVAGFSEFSLAKGGNGWRLAQPLQRRDPAKRYTIYAWSNANDWSADGPEFTAAEVAGLHPSDVLTFKPESEGNRTESLADFRTKTCENWDH
ncbi:MAG: hypothetical protein HOV67_12680 [Kribbellaceae bacterium]|nr:hypothetical protein [Kribbellaceae bacterium]